jgi:hypothetical protein
MLSIIHTDYNSCVENKSSKSKLMGAYKPKIYKVELNFGNQFSEALVKHIKIRQAPNLPVPKIIYTLRSASSQFLPE